MRGQMKYGSMQTPNFFLSISRIGFFQKLFYSTFVKKNPIPYLIAVDGGGTGCRVVIARPKGGILASAESGPANIATAFGTALHTIIKTASEAWQKAGLEAATMPQAVAVLGLAGANIDDVAQRLKRSLPFTQSYVTDDRETTLRGALAGADGCLAAVGTGSFFCSQNAGVTRSIGGWGFSVGDDGGGARLGQDLLRRVLHCHDGIENHSDLTRSVLQAFDNDPAAISTFALSASPHDFGCYAPQVIKAADAGDPQGVNLRTSAVNAIQTALEAVGFTGQQRLCMCGGLGRAVSGVLDPVYRDNLVKPKGDALAGGLAIAQSILNQSQPIQNMDSKRRPLEN